MKTITLLLLLLATSALTMRLTAQDNFAKGTNYHLISLDAVTSENIPAGAIKKDFRVDDINNFLYVWSGTYNALVPAGPNWNGEIGEFISLQVGSVGWSGFGFSGPAAKDMTAVTADYTLHLAMRAPSTSTASHCIKMEGPGGLAGFAAIGSANFVDGSNIYKPYTNFVRDNNWHLIEIPMSYFFNQGLRYPEAVPAFGNVFALLSGGVAGTSIALDAIYVYKKTVTSINELSSNRLQILQTSKTLTVVDALAPIELYNITGTKIRSSYESIMGIEGIQKGIYIVRCGSFSKKIEIK
jgi:hypothetical protein